MHETRNNNYNTRGWHRWPTKKQQSSDDVTATMIMIFLHSSAFGKLNQYFFYDFLGLRWDFSGENEDNFTFCNLSDVLTGDDDFFNVHELLSKKS